VAAIELERLTKVYADGTRAVHELDLEIEDGEFVVFVGPSGCGKTSALRMVAGLEEITSGVVRVGGDVVNDLPPKARDMAMIFQNYALYPHMNVFDNMGFGLKMRGIDRVEIRRRVEDLLKEIDRNKREPSPQQLQPLRAVEVLEHIGTSEAKAILERLAQGTPALRLTEDAKGSLERFTKKK